MLMHSKLDRTEFDREIVEKFVKRRQLLRGGWFGVKITHETEMKRIGRSFRCVKTDLPTLEHDVIWMPRDRPANLPVQSAKLPTGGNAAAMQFDRLPSGA